MANTKDQYLRYTLLIIVLILGGILFHESLPFLSGGLGACTVYIMVRKQMWRLVHKRNMKKSKAAILIVLEALLCFLVPSFLAVWLLAGKITTIDLNTLVTDGHHLIDWITEKTGFDLLNTQNLSKIALSATGVLQVIADQVSGFVINSLVLLFVLYFMLLGSEPMEKYLYDILPFSEKDKRRVINEINKMVRANAIGIPLLAVIQGFFATIAYFIFGAPDPILFGFLTCFATIIPVFGTALVWAPLALYIGFSGHWGAALGLVAYALLVISNIDNFVRFMLQEKIASTHPLITVFGVIIGLSIFGFWGIIFGPLLFSMFFLCFDIYKREYIDSRKIVDS